MAPSCRSWALTLILTCNEGDSHAQPDRPAEASALPVSDKPVTLSLKGGLTSKAGGAMSISLASAKKAPISSAFSMNEDAAPGDENASDDEQQKAASDDLKGWFHASRCIRAAV